MTGLSHPGEEPPPYQSLTFEVKPPAVFHSREEPDGMSTLVGSAVAGALIVAYTWSKFRKENAANKAEASLYSNLSGEVSRLVERVTALEGENVKLRRENEKLRMGIVELSGLEEDNQRLVQKLEHKDAHAERLMSELLGAHESISQLTERIHQLEMRLQSVPAPSENCKTCVSFQGYP